MVVISLPLSTEVGVVRCGLVNSSAANQHTFRQSDIQLRRLKCEIIIYKH